MPAGVIGNPHATPQCSRVEFGAKECSPSTQVGWNTISITANTLDVPVYNLEPTAGQAGVLGFYVPLAEAPAYIVLSARTGSDYGLNATLEGIEHLVPPNRLALDLWGIPAASSHDAERAPPGLSYCYETTSCSPPIPSSAEVIPFLDNPTTCGGPLTSTLELVAYDTGVSQASAPWPATTGCDQLSFNPSLYAQPTSKEGDSPSGLEADLKVPQSVSPSAPSASEIRALTVSLPLGLSINPSAADGKTSCTDLEARFGTEEEAECPEDSKIGTVSLSSAALPAAIPGAVYIGTPAPNDRYRLILTANGYGTHVKLGGSVTPDPNTGQLLVSFPNLPQSPFSEFAIHLFGSERGLLATPTACGTYPVSSSFTPWDASLPEQTSTQYFAISSGPSGAPCATSPPAFSPGFSAAIAESTAGAHTPLALEITRPDGNQHLSGVAVSIPPGLLATIKGIPYCSDADLATAAAASYSGLQQESSSACPQASQIGTAQVGAGAGTHPVYLDGAVYLAGPYKGAPLSLAVITPAVSGPYDLGNVVVRASLQVNTETAGITAVSDPLPQILDGIPLQLRSIRVSLNRPNFILNPTNCDPFAFNAQITGDQGALVELSEHLQVANCRSLPFSPKLGVRLSGAHTHNGNPALTTTVTSQPGEANIASTTVTLSHSEFLDNAHIRDPCLRSQFAEDSCPPASLIGFAKAETPLLEKPLEGPVYLRANGGERKLPDIVAALRGQINIDLVGFVDSVHGQIRTKFANIPDAPISSFTLSLAGGSKGLLVNSTNLCNSPQHVDVRMVGQNGKTITAYPTIGVRCAKETSRARRKRPANR